jgi:UDP-N-acetylmuramoyl-tripeptide--D-alanyl-D-alanine ligase
LRLIEINSLKFIDDTYNSNPLSLGAALEALEKSDSPGRKILVMGDMLELGSRARSFHRSAGKRIARSCDCLIAVGEFSGLAAEAARLNGLAKGNIFTCVDSASARDILLNEVAASRDDLILVKGSRSMKMEEVLKI